MTINVNKTCKCHPRIVWLRADIYAHTTGCNISMPQAESSYRFVKGLISSDNISMQEQQPIWLASVGDRGAVLRPYISGGLTVFANTDGDAIAFDGWTIRSIVGFGIEGPVSIAGKDGIRTFTGPKLRQQNVIHGI